MAKKVLPISDAYYYVDLDKSNMSYWTWKAYTFDDIGFVLRQISGWKIYQAFYPSPGTYGRKFKTKSGAISNWKAFSKRNNMKCWEFLSLRDLQQSHCVHVFKKSIYTSGSKLIEYKECARCFFTPVSTVIYDSKVVL